MGLPRKIALTGGLLIAAVVGVAILAKKTNVLEGVKTGLQNIGSSIGSGLGKGLQNFGTSFFGDLTGIGSDKAQSNWLSNQAGLQDILKGVNPFADPRVQQAYGEVSPGAAGAAAAAGDTTVTPASRAYSDLVGQTIVVKTPTQGGYKSYSQQSIVSAKPITINGINTVDIRTNTGFFSKPLAERLEIAAKNNAAAAKPTTAKAQTGGSRPAPSSSNKSTTTYKASNGKTYTLTKAKGGKK